MRQIIHPQTGDKSFDTRVHIRDQKGVLVDVRPYSLHVRGGESYYVDKKTGLHYAANGDLLEKPQPASQVVSRPPVPPQAPPVVANKRGRPAGSPGKPAQEKTGPVSVPPVAPQVAPEVPPLDPLDPPAEEGDENPEPLLVDPEQPSSGNQGL